MHFKLLYGWLCCAIFLLAACSSSETLTAPTKLTTTPGQGKIALNWQDNSDNETGFAIYRQTTSASAALTAQQLDDLDKIGSVGADVTQYEDTDVEPGVFYRYGVSAEGEGGASTIVTSEISVADVDDTAPTVTIEDPGELTERKTATLSGTASDSVGVSKVEIYEDTILLGTATLSDGNWSYDYIPAAVGDYTLKAVASDAAGNTNEASQAVTVVVDFSLRLAIQYATSGDTITIPSSINTITLAGGAILINKNLTIIGDVTIDANNASSHFVVSPSFTLTLKDLTLTKGRGESGGAIFNRGTLILQGDTSISGNTSSGDGGGVYNNSGATLTLQGSSSISGNTSSSDGGGVYNDNSTLTLAGTASISGNTASDYGGGVYNIKGSTMTLQDSSGISGNTSSNSGGGVYNFNSTLTLSGTSSISANTATVDGGGVYRSKGSLIGADYEGNDVGSDGVYNIYDNTPNQVAP